MRRVAVLDADGVVVNFALVEDTDGASLDELLAARDAAVSEVETAERLDAQARSQLRRAEADAAKPDGPPNAAAAVNAARAELARAEPRLVAARRSLDDAADRVRRHWQPPAGHTVVPVLEVGAGEGGSTGGVGIALGVGGDPPQIGGRWDGAQFHPAPVVPRPPTVDEQIDALPDPTVDFDGFKAGLRQLLGGT